MKKQNKKIHGSSSAFAWGRIVFTEYKGGCLRTILLNSYGVREGDIQEKYKILGALNEERHEEILKESGVKYDREFVVKQAVPSNPTVSFSGRVDFVQHLDSGIVVEELKSTDNKNKLREVIKNGTWVTENLAQLVSYMVALRTPIGRLIYTYYDLDKTTGKYEAKKDRAFEVVIDDAGRICVDSAPTRFTVHDQIAHTQAAAKVIETGEIWDRPYHWNMPFKSPCIYCPFSGTCDAYDAGAIKDVTDFVMSAKKDIDKLEGAKNE